MFWGGLHTFGSVEGSEAGVPLWVGEVGAEGQGEAAPGRGVEVGVHAGLQLLQRLSSTETGDLLPTWIDLDGPNVETECSNSCVFTVL